MGAPQLPENAPAKKRGELYGNRIQGLGIPAGTPPSRSSSPLPPADDSPTPSPRKRCVSTGGALLKSTPPRFAPDEPAPPLPPTPTLSVARRNSLAVDFGPAKCVTSSDELPQSADEDCELSPPPPSLSPSLGVGEASGLVSPPPTPKDALPKDVDVPSLAGEESEVTELASQDDSNLAPAIALDMGTTSQSSLEVMTVVKAIPTAEPGQTSSPASDELSGTSHYPALSVDTSVSDAQPSEAALPLMTTSQSSLEVITVVEAISIVDPDQTNSPTSDELSRTSQSVDTVSNTRPSEAALPYSCSTTMASTSIVAPNEHDSELSHLLVSTTDASESAATTNKEYDDAAQFSSASESPITEEPGTISISVPHPKIEVQHSFPSPELNTGTTKVEPKRSFTAVVHRKVTEMPAATAPMSTLSAPITPQIARVRRMGITISAEPPSSPGYGELATLLEEAALLEMRLTEGDISTPLEPLQPAPAQIPTSDTVAPDIRSGSSSTLTEHVKAPSTESASFSERSVSIPSILEPNMGGNIPEEDDIDGRSLASTSASQRSPSHRKYLSSIRRLTGRRSSNYMPGAYPRDSISTCSEDSAAITTPSDHGSGEGFGIAWPSVSPKKGGTSRSSSFADKLFNRNRTKSNVSTMETDQGPIYNSSVRSFTLSQPPSPAPPKSSQGRHVPEVQGSRSSPWTTSRDSSSSPAPSILDKELFDAFPSVPQTLPPGPAHLSPDLSEVAVRRLSTVPVKGRKHQQQRMSMV
ncbi:hypothetical protein AZE42_09313 [Rhizopogon vesiculosus]|uniref:Uncharacterized protein n=1 Tax=Rhizopogon vesiculosus TaxID=180088 RepID=A0A1J8QJ69_9AGAM|nr:hypothetical protein AZE42_09313 [Rhizopogon vesiculosus]